MYFVIDLGGSTIDIVRVSSKGYHHVQTFESSSLQAKDPKEWIFQHAIASQILHDKKLVITGGKSLFLPEYYEYHGKKIQLQKIHEFEALALGAQKLSGFSNGLAISMGTGTAMVAFDACGWEHVKGTGVGGGTLMGLSRALLHENICFSELISLAEKGFLENINVSVGDIVGGGIGTLDEKATASNFAKFSSQSRPEDIALGIITLVSESIVALAIEKSLRLGNIPIIGGGKLAKLDFLQTKMKEAAAVFAIPIFFPEDAGLMTAVGAGLK